MKSYLRFYLLLSLLGLTCFLFVIYSFAHIDLNLTLSSHFLYQAVQTRLLQLGYYQRPYSTFVFLVLLTSLSGVYMFSLRQHFSAKQLLLLVGVTSVLLFAYPAFSHDVFNYLFDARIVTRYGFDPHYFKALDFPGDTWIRFMHWTHRYYPYGPGWLLITLFPSLLGQGKFVLTLLLFKVSLGFFHAASCFLIYQLVKKTDSGKEKTATLFFALNPLVLFESLMTPHNEVVMLTFTLLALYALVLNMKARSLLLLLLSASVKYVSIILLPLVYYWRKEKTQQFFNLAFIIWGMALIPQILFRELYSWYFIPLVGLAAITTKNQWPRFIVAGLSLGTLLRYAPFFFFGDYGILTTRYEWWFFAGGTGLGCLLYYLLLWRNRVHV